MPAHLRLAVVCAALAVGAAAQAQTVALSGMMGGKALLLVDGKPPKSLAPGESYLGVKLLSLAPDEAVVEIGGKRTTLHLGESPVNVKGKGGGANKIVLIADSQGHFIGPGKINGQAMQFVVDTGATSVSLGMPEADRLGINYKSGEPIRLSTANGSANGWRVRLGSVRVGDVEISGVEAVISPASMPYVLLGNSFLTQFQMTRINDQMVLERRY
ncbi:TIGR02281 family clan AA aspartic protease [Rhodoferax sp.]|uniref:retropepsin-like aspartic protease family protein n=1 Tax=Rhodoferax sp. TaxID=50421 RepID=UPI00374CF4B6